MDPVEAFSTVDMRVGRITRVEPNEQARKPAYKLWIDFGQPPEGLGVKQSGAQITELYSPEDLLGRLVIGVVNLPARRIAGFKSEVLVLGVPDAEGRVVLLEPKRAVPRGSRVF